MLTTGLLWHEPNPGVSLAARVDAAAERFFERYGREPNICLVPPEESTTVTSITVKQDPRMRAGRILVGYDPEDRAATSWKAPAAAPEATDVVLLDAAGNEMSRYKAPPAKKSARGAVSSRQPRPAGRQPA